MKLKMNHDFARCLQMSFPRHMIIEYTLHAAKWHCLQLKSEVSRKRRIFTIYTALYHRNGS